MQGMRHGMIPISSNQLAVSVKGLPISTIQLVSALKPSNWWFPFIPFLIPCSPARTHASNEWFKGWFCNTLELSWALPTPKSHLLKGPKGCGAYFPKRLRGPRRLNETRAMDVGQKLQILDRSTHWANNQSLRPRVENFEDSNSNNAFRHLSVLLLGVACLWPSMPFLCVNLRAF